MTALTPLARRLQTERLELTPQQPCDAPWLAALLTERGHGEVGEEEARERIARVHASYAAHGIDVLVLRRRDDPEPLGYVGLLRGRSTPEEPELVYELLARHHGRGYATEAARAVLDAAWETGRRRLWLTTRPDNAASLRVAGKLGFVHDRETADPQGPVVWLRREPDGPAVRPTGMRVVGTLLVLGLLLLATGCGSGGGTSAADDPAGATPTESPTATGTSPAPLPPRKSPSLPGAGGPVTVEGVVSAGVEAGCLLLEPTDGSAGGPWLLVGGSPTPRPGDRVRVTGTPDPGLMTTCQQGTPLQVSALERG